VEDSEPIQVRCKLFFLFLLIFCFLQRISALGGMRPATAAVIDNCTFDYFQTRVNSHFNGSALSTGVLTPDHRGRCEWPATKFSCNQADSPSFSAQFNPIALVP
jgi:hypothetical protein